MKKKVTLVMSPRLRERALLLACTSAAALYMLTILIAEPLRTMANTSTQNSVITLTVNGSIANTCDATLNIGTIVGTGDSSTTNGYDSADKITCVVQTNNITGYTLGWQVTTGTGATGARTGTGYMNGFISGNRLAPFKPVVANTPEIWNTGTIVASDSRWAARLSSTSTTATGAGMTWGSDVGGANDKWLNVATGSLINIAKRTSQTSGPGDSEILGFRAIIGSTKIQPSDTYRVTVVLTATTNP